MTAKNWIASLLACLPKLFGVGMVAFATFAAPAAHAIRTPLDPSPGAIAEAHVAAPSDAWLIEAVYPVGQADDGDCIELAVLVEPETHTRVWCYVKSPLGLHEFTYKYGGGDEDFVVEAFVPSLAPPPPAPKPYQPDCWISAAPPARFTPQRVPVLRDERAYQMSCLRQCDMFVPSHFIGTPMGERMMQMQDEMIVMAFAEPGIGYICSGIKYGSKVGWLAMAEGKSLQQARMVVSLSDEFAKAPLVALPAGSAPAAPLYQGAAGSQGVTFFSDDVAQFYRLANPTLGGSGSEVWFMPLDDAAGLTTPHSVARASGYAPSVKDAWISGDPIYGVVFPLRNRTYRLPVPADAGGYKHFLEGGSTAIRLADESGYLLNPTREFVTPGGSPVSAGSYLFQLTDEGAWRVVRQY